MDVKHLNNEELSYELYIRYVNGLSDKSTKQKALREILYKEQSSLIDAPSTNRNIPSTSEIKQCRDKLIEIKQLVTPMFKSGDLQMMDFYRSKIIHVRDRINRVSAESQDEQLEIEALSTATKKWLDAISRFKAGKLVKFASKGSLTSITDISEGNGEEMASNKEQNKPDTVPTNTEVNKSSNACETKNQEGNNKGAIPKQNTRSGLGETIKVATPTCTTQSHAFGRGKTLPNWSVNKVFDFGINVPNGENFGAQANGDSFQPPIPQNKFCSDDKLTQNKTRDEDVNKNNLIKLTNDDSSDSDNDDKLVMKLFRKLGITSKTLRELEMDKGPSENVAFEILDHSNTSRYGPDRGLFSSPDVETGDEDYGHQRQRNECGNVLYKVPYQEPYQNDQRGRYTQERFNINPGYSPYQDIRHEPPNRDIRRYPQVNQNYEAFRCEHRGNLQREQNGRRNAERRPPYRNHRNGKPVHSWDVRFTGESGTSLNDFLDQAEMLAIAEQIEPEELLSSIIHLLKGRAFDWYRSNFRSFRTWQQFKEMIRDEFYPENYDQLLLWEIETRVQSRNEPFGSYLGAMKRLFNCLQHPLSENYMLYVVKKGLSPVYAMNLATTEINSLDQLARLCKRIDNTKLMIDRQKCVSINKESLLEPEMSVPSRFVNKKQVQAFERVDDNNDNDKDKDDDEKEIFALIQKFLKKNKSNDKKNDEKKGQNGKQNKGGEIKCWNCKADGHGFNDCPLPRKGIFCFHCGKENILSRNCPDYNSNNDSEKKEVATTTEENPEKEEGNSSENQ